MERARRFASSAYLEVGDVAAIDIVGPITIHAWINQTSGGAVVSKYAAGGGNGQYLLRTSTLVGFFMLDGSSNGHEGFSPAGSVRNGVWTPIAGRSKGAVGAGAIQAFANGISGTADSLPSDNPNSGSALRFGLDSNNANAFTGDIAEVAIWNVALTDEEIRWLAAGADPERVRPGSLKGYWPLDEYGPSGVSYDRTQNANTAAMPGANATLAPGPQQVLFGESFVAAEADLSDEISAPFLTVGATGLVPDLEGPEQLDVPFATIGVNTYVPTQAGAISPPFYKIGFQPRPVFVLEGELPPFVPPSLPPTLVPGSPVGPGVPLPPLSSGGLGGIRFYQGPPWRWVVTDLATNTLTFLDRLAFEAEVRYILNRAATAKLSAPADNPEVNILDTDGFPFVDEGDRLLYGFRREGGTSPDGKLWVCRYAGTIRQTEDTGLTEDARTILAAEDPWSLLYQRPMINVDFEFPDDAGFFSFDDTQVGVIALIFLRNTQINNGTVGIDTPLSFATATGMPGSGFWSGTIETTTAIDIAFQQGMSVGEVWDQLVQSGYLDIVLTPIYDPVRRPGYTHELSIYNRVGSPRPDAVMAWDKPSRNLVRFNHVKDGYKRANTVRYYENQGGQPVGPTHGFSDGASITRYGEYWAQQFFPSRVEAAVTAFAELQLLLRAEGIDTVQIEPTNERAPFLFTEWFLGDTVPIFASNKARQAIAAFQRIYGIVLRIDENAYERIPQVLGSPEDA